MAATAPEPPTDARITTRELMCSAKGDDLDAGEDVVAIGRLDRSAVGDTALDELLRVCSISLEEGDVDDNE